MKKTAARKPLSKMFVGFIVLLIVLGLISAVLLTYGDQTTRKREEEQLNLKLNVIGENLANREKMQNIAKERFEANLKKKLWLMSSSLQELMSDNGSGYSGKRVFSEGFVAEISGDSALLPEGAPEGLLPPDRKLIEESLASGAVLTDRYQSGTEGEESSPEWTYLSFAKITDSLVYVMLTPESEYTAYLDLYRQGTNEVLRKTDSFFGGVTLVFEERDGKPILTGQMGDALSVDSPEEIGLTEEMIRNRVSSLRVNGVDYECSYLSSPSGRIGEEELLLVQLLPRLAYQTYGGIAFMLTLAAMVLALGGIVIYACTAERRIQSGKFSPEEWERYRPKKLRRQVICAGLTGLVLVLVITLLTQGLCRVFIELEYDSDALNIVSEQLKEEYYARRDDIIRTHESWYAGYGKEMTELISENPELARREWLQKNCDELDIDFIMLFDGEGRETVCSRDYEGFTLKEGLGENTTDFRRLLMGIPFLVHEASDDPITGLERQMIGVTIPPSEKSPSRGALIMALMPDAIPGTEGITDSNLNLAHMVTDDIICMIAKQETGEIIAASATSLTGKTTAECGLPAESLKDGYMNLNTINGAGCLTITSRVEDAVFYCATYTAKISASVLAYTGLAGLLFILALIIVILFLLRGYSEKKLSDCGDIGMQAEESSSERTPEERAILFCRLCLILMIVYWVILLTWKGTSYRNFDSLGSYLLLGNWTKGFNLFAIHGILLVVVSAYVINLLGSLLLKMISGFVRETGQTICTLIASAIRYIAILVSGYFALIYIGVPIGPVVGSLGVASVALSLGAKDLAADIIAGLFIVIEGSFHVGDYIEMKGTRGYVKEIGIRSTVLVLSGDNIKTVNNHLISEVVNLSSMASTYVQELKVSSSFSLDRMEELLAKELPEISKRCDKLIGDLRFAGIASFGKAPGMERDTSVVIRIKAKCLEKDISAVSDFVRMEMFRLMERENIPLG